MGETVRKVESVISHQDTEVRLKETYWDTRATVELPCSMAPSVIELFVEQIMARDSMRPSVRMAPSACPMTFASRQVNKWMRVLPQYWVRDCQPQEPLDQATLLTLHNSNRRQIHTQ